MAYVNKYSNIASALEEDAESSDTYFGSASPSASDIALNKKILKNAKTEDTAMSEEAKKRWYPTTTEANVDMATSPKKEEKSYIGNFLKALGSPLYAEVGAVESLLGKGTKKGLLENIKSNVEEQEGFGSLYRKMGMGKTASILLGLGTDIIGDPVNIISAGTASLLPRVIKGAVKGGAVGAAKGLATSIPGKMLEGTVKFGTKFAGEKGSTLAKTIAEKQLKNLDDYNKIIGHDPMEKLLDVYNNGSFASNVFDKTEEVIKKLPGGDTFLDTFIYRPVSTWRKNKLIIEAEKTSKAMADNILEEGSTSVTEAQSTLASKRIKTLDEFKKASMAAGKWDDDAEEGYQKVVKSFNETELRTRTAGARVMDSGVDAVLDTGNTGRVTSDKLADALSKEYYDQAAVLAMNDKIIEAGFTPEEISEALKVMRVGKEESKKTGWKVYDEINQKITDYKIKDVAVGQKMADTYNTLLGAFKTIKVGNPSSIVTAILSNPTMALMKGLDIFSSQYVKSVNVARKILGGTAEGKSYAQLLDSPVFATYIQRYPELFKAVTGFHPKFILNKTEIAEQLNRINNTDELKVLFKDYSEEQKKEMLEKMHKELRSVFSIAGKSDTLEPGYKLNKSPFASMLAGEESFGTSTFVAQELDITAYKKLVNLVGEKAAAGNPAYKMLNWYLTKPIEVFEQVDQTYKLANIIHLTQEGVTENEIMRMTKLGRYKPGKAIQSSLKKGEQFNWSSVPDDVKFIVGNKGQLLASRGDAEVFLDPVTKRYKFTPDKALEESSEIYMNYAAMPKAVKVLRSLPVLGSPFVAFQWAMLHKTGQTIVSNPELLNKIQFAIGEINGGRSPLERSALEKPYYQWYNKMGMVSLPFFQDNPLYLNLAPFLPYYSMNLFQPSERNYEKTLGGDMAKFIDATPFFKTPEGGILLDYFLMPMLMRESDATGQFNQTLFPTDATALEKAKIITMQAIESYTQNNIPAALGLVTPESALEWIPNYKWKKVGYAKEGKGLHGVQTKEERNSLVMRNILSAYTGINLYPLKLQY